MVMFSAECIFSGFVKLITVLRQVLLVWYSSDAVTQNFIFNVVARESLLCTSHRPHHIVLFSNCEVRRSERCATVTGIFVFLISVCVGQLRDALRRDLECVLVISSDFVVADGLVALRT